MNDANELRTGVTALKMAYEREKPNLTDEEQRQLESIGLLHDSAVYNSFLVSASEDHDLLTLWRFYGNAQVAYSLGFDRDVPLMPREQVRGHAHPSPPPDYRDYDWMLVDARRQKIGPDPDSCRVMGGRWKVVTYVNRDGEHSHTEYIRSRLEKLQSDMAVQMWLEFGGNEDNPFNFEQINLEKDSGFMDEREVRILVDLNPDWKFVKFRETQFGLVPYIELTTSAAADDRGFVPVDADCRLPICHIVVGPTGNAEAAKYALRLFLDNAGYGDVTIGSSEIPFR